MSTLRDKSPWLTSAHASSKSISQLRAPGALAACFAAPVLAAGGVAAPGAHAPHAKSAAALTTRLHAATPATRPLIEHQVSRTWGRSTTGGTSLDPIGTEPEPQSCLRPERFTYPDYDDEYAVECPYDDSGPFGGVPSAVPSTCREYPLPPGPVFLCCPCGS